MTLAVRQGSFASIRYLHTRGKCACTENDALIAVDRGRRLEIIVYLLRRSRDPPNPSLVLLAVRTQNLACLWYLHHVCRRPFHINEMHIAADNGDVLALLYLMRQGCPWTESVCAHARGSKRFDCIRLIEQYSVRDASPYPRPLVAPSYTPAPGTGCAPDHLDRSNDNIGADLPLIAAAAATDAESRGTLECAVDC